MGNGQAQFQAVRSEAPESLTEPDAFLALFLRVL